MDEEELRRCLNSGECKLTVYKKEGCGACSDVKKELDEKELPYKTKEVTAEDIVNRGIKTVPQLYIEKNGEQHKISKKDLEKL